MAMTERFQFVRYLCVDSRSHVGGVLNKNTEKNTKWAMNTWNEWVAARNGARLLGQPMFPVAVDLQYATPQQMDEYLSYFVLEVRNKDGKLYPRESLYNLMCGLARYVKTVLLRSDLNFLSMDNKHFSRFRKVFKSQLKLVEEEVTVKHKHVQLITLQQEAMLWDKGVLNTNTSTGLSKVVYFYNCKFFEVYSREEHRGLMADQYSFGSDSEGRYIEFKRSEDQRRPNVLNTVRHRYAAGDHSVYNVFTKYLDCVGNEGCFYRRPSAWDLGLVYERPLGLHVISSYMATIMKEAGFSGVYTGVSVKGLSQPEGRQTYIAPLNSLPSKGQAVQRGNISLPSHVQRGNISLPSHVQRSKKSLNSGPKTVSKRYKRRQCESESKQNNKTTHESLRREHKNFDTDASRQELCTLTAQERGSNNHLENQENYVHKKLRFWNYLSKYEGMNTVGKTEF